MDVLQALRKEKKCSQQAIADYLGITRQAYSNYEAGKREPDYETLLKLGEFFGVSSDYLLKGKESRPNKTSDDDIMFALFGGKVDDETFEDVKRFAAFIKAEKEQKRNEDSGD